MTTAAPTRSLGTAGLSRSLDHARDEGRQAMRLVATTTRPGRGTRPQFRADGGQLAMLPGEVQALAEVVADGEHVRRFRPARRRSSSRSAGAGIAAAPRWSMKSL